MSQSRLLIAATGSGSGKTLITCGLLALFAAEQKKVAAIKCGPDYIDPMFHRSVLGVESKNLDTFFTGEARTRELLADFQEGKDLVVMEGVMGLYDGLGGIREEGSSYHLAKVTDTPIILVVNAHGMGKSILATIRGFLDYDTAHLIKGVLLNQTSKQFYEVIKPEIEAECKVPVVGFLPRQKDVTLESRHLGLVMPEEIADIKQQLGRVADALRDCVDIEKLLAIAATAGTLETGKKRTIPRLAEGCRIGVARDAAFCFYYEDNLRLLEQAGAELVYFSPLSDSRLPEHISGLLLGGGYPELYAKQLSENHSMRQSIADSIEKKIPVVAECGGFLYLHENLTTNKNETYPMVGVIPGDCFYTGKLVRFGYVSLQEKKPCFLGEGQNISGHEFHYYDSTSNGTDVCATKPVTGRSWDCVHERDGQWMGFAHLYYESNPGFAYSFLRKVAAYKD